MNNKKYIKTIFLHRIIDLNEINSIPLFDGELGILKASIPTINNQYNANIKSIFFNEREYILNTYISNKIDIHKDTLYIDNNKKKLYEKLNGYYYYNSTRKRIEIIKKEDDNIIVEPLDLTGNVFSIPINPPNEPTYFDNDVIINKNLYSINFENSQFQFDGFSIKKNENGKYTLEIENIIAKNVIAINSLYSNSIYEFVDLNQIINLQQNNNNNFSYIKNIDVDTYYTNYFNIRMAEGEGNSTVATATERLPTTFLINFDNNNILEAKIKGVFGIKTSNINNTVYAKFRFRCNNVSYETPEYNTNSLDWQYVYFELNINKNDLINGRWTSTLVVRASSSSHTNFYYLGNIYLMIKEKAEVIITKE